MSGPESRTTAVLPDRGSASALVRALRPKQWIKNLVLLAGILFTLDQAHPFWQWLRVGAGILVFCAVASSIYLVNDVCDAEQDRLHPRKRLRPVAAGEITIREAQVTAVLLMLGGLTASFSLGQPFALVTAIYLLTTVLYSLVLKHVVILDVMTLASFYVIRATAGAVVVGVEISPWLLVCTTLGALLLGLAKRRNELLLLEDAGSHRRILTEYTPQMLDHMIGICAACALMAYMLYTFSSQTGRQHPLMMLTIPFVIYGILRFLVLIHRHGKGGDPSAELFEDRGLLICGVGWALTCALIMFAGR